MKSHVYKNSCQAMTPVMCIVFTLTLFYSTTDATYHIPHTISSCQHSLHVAHLQKMVVFFLGVLTWRDGRCSSVVT